MKMRKIAAGISLGAMALAMTGQVEASSHREAPFIAKNPKTDATDLYAFMSYETGKAGNVVLIANYQPLQDAYGGPNYFSMDPEALYEIHIENNGDGVEDLTFQFQFKNNLVDQQVAANGTMVSHPLVNAGGIATAAYGTMGDARNVRETFALSAVKGPRRGSAPVAINNATAKFGGAVAAGQNTFIKPMDNIGTKTFGTTLGGEAYATYAAAHIYDITLPATLCADNTAHTGRVFVGQREDTFAVNLGTIFDLINAPGAIITGGDTEAGRNVAPNTIKGKNVTSLSLEIPKECLVTNVDTAPVIGVWTTASVRQARVINPKATYGTPAKEGGAWAQISRLGNPLVNEVVIGLRDKDRFNSSEPKDDLANFGPYVTNPTLPALIETLFSVPAPTASPRADLIAVFLTGVKTPNLDDGGNELNVNYTGAALAEMLRLNTKLGATTGAARRADGLGAAACFRTDATAPTKIKPSATGCDPSGFPNGRRPGDDVVDLALRVMEGYLLPVADAPMGATAFTDGVMQFFGTRDVPATGGVSTTQSTEAFPFLNLPTSGS